MNLLLLLFGGILAKDFCFETENKAKLLDVISFAMKRTKEKIASKTCTVTLNVTDGDHQKKV